MAEATLKHSKDVLATEKKNHKALVKACEEVRGMPHSQTILSTPGSGLGMGLVKFTHSCHITLITSYTCVTSHSSHSHCTHTHTHTHTHIHSPHQQDKALLDGKCSEVEAEEGTYNDLQERSRAAEKAVQTAQQHYQAVTAGLCSSADGQDETLAAQKIGERNPRDY